MDRRSVVSGVTLLVLSGILVLGAMWGWNALFPEPGPASDESVAAPTCTPTPSEPQVVRTRDVVVSVYNAGDRAGQAGRVLTLLERRGFRPGALGNAPEGEKVRRARVISPNVEDPAARLVARHLGRRVEVVEGDRLGPGVTVLVGNRLNQLPRAKRSIKVPADEATC
ncbi:MAG: LytR C-terminal domain-containing protein [Nocardioides sp.]|nr:LytR C-terminal domain-containing protein [Nocardioides sp.]